MKTKTKTFYYEDKYAISREAWHYQYPNGCGGWLAWASDMGIIKATAFLKEQHPSAILDKRWHATETGRV